MLGEGRAPSPSCRRDKCASERVSDCGLAGATEFSLPFSKSALLQDGRYSTWTEPASPDSGYQTKSAIIPRTSIAHCRKVCTLDEVASSSAQDPLGATASGCPSMQGERGTRVSSASLNNECRQSARQPIEQPSRPDYGRLKPTCSRRSRTASARVMNGHLREPRGLGTSVSPCSV